MQVSFHKTEQGEDSLASWRAHNMQERMGENEWVEVSGYM